MTVAVVFNEEKQVDQILPWAVALAHSRGTGVLAIIVTRGKSADSRWSDVDLNAADSSIPLLIAAHAEKLNLVIPPVAGLVDADLQTTDPSHEVANPKHASERPAIPIVVKKFRASEPVSALAAEIESLKIDLLVIPNYAASRNEQDDCLWHGQLFRRAPCEAMFLHDDIVRDNGPPRVLVVVTGKEDDTAALKCGLQLTQATEGTLTAYNFEPAIDDVAEQVGIHMLAKAVKTALGSSSDLVFQRTVLADSLFSGLREIHPERFDIVLVGTRQRREIRKIMDAISANESVDIPAICAIRSKVPLTNRLLNRLQNAVERYIPQLSREQRISLVERVQTSSQWDFDFVALICLSTLIAALGLIDDSVAVVIGAMLVAPLMTPIVGGGLGLAQGNMLLIKTSFRTVLRGFATALFIGIVVGLVVFGFRTDPVPTNEMAARDLPGFLDLVVALVSGIAAAYALGRPNLLAAIPGVAIAAALVPPLATSGLSVALFDAELLLGSMLLFLTNIVAIVLGTTVTFWLVGVRSEKKDKQSPTWPRWLFLALIILTIALTALIEAMHHPDWWG